MRDWPLCCASNIYIYFVCVSDLCCVNECLKCVSNFLIGAGLLSEAGLGLGDVDFDAVSTFCGGVLSY